MTVADAHAQSSCGGDADSGAHSRTHARGRATPVERDGTVRITLRLFVVENRTDPLYQYRENQDGLLHHSPAATTSASTSSRKDEEEQGDRRGSGNVLWHWTTT